MFFRHGDSEFFLFPRLVARRKTSSSISLTSLILTISLISLCLIVCNAFSVVHIMLFPGHKLFSSLVAFKICLHHASVTLFVSGAAPPKKYAGSTPCGL